MAAIEDFQPVVCDNGTETMKVGFAGDDSPAAVFPTAVGRRRSSHIHIDYESRGSRYDSYAGAAAQSNKSIYSMSYPIDRGLIADWDDMERIWSHAFDSLLGIHPEEHPVLLTEPPRSPEENRERMLQIMFETFDVPAAFVAVPALLSLYSCGRTTGIAFDSGHGLSHTVPIYEGYILHEGIQCLNLAGLDLNEALKNQLAATGYTFSTTSELEIVTDIKKNLCYVAHDFDEEFEKAKSGSSDVEEIYELPDGQEITVSAERFMCPEVLFRPSLVRNTASGIQELIYDSITKCDVDTRNQLYSNIVLTGGSTMFPGIADRLRKEIGALLQNSTEINVFENREPYSVWIGGSILASLSSFQKDWISKEEYEEVGSSVANHR